MRSRFPYMRITFPLLMLTLALPSCDQPPPQSAFHVVTVQGVEACLNCSVYSPVTLLRSEPDSVTLVARDGDLLMLDENLFYPYQADDGDTLHVTLEPRGAVVNGKVRCLDLTESLDTWTWLHQATDQDLRSVRVVSVPMRRGNLPAGEVSMLGKLAEASPEAFVLLIDEENRPGILLQPFLKTYVSQVSEPDRPLAVSDISTTVRSVYLFGNTTIAGHTSLLDRGSSIQCLFGPAPAPDQDLPQDLRSLTITPMNENRDLAFLTRVPQLRVLSLTLAGVPDIRPIATLSNLTTLSLAGTKAGEGFASVIKKLPLTWISFPGDVSQSDFDMVIRDHPQLAVVELADCDNVKDLRPLLRLRDLQSLILADTPDESLNFGVLQRMRTLRLLALPDDTDPELRTRLQKALPNCVIAEAKLCLGSAWILALVPVVVAAVLLRRRRQPATT